MRIVAAQEFESWLASGEVLERDARGPKVLALENGLYLKIFHTRRHPLLARLQPAAKRFAYNAERLQYLDIPTPEVVETLWLDRTKGLSACIYRPLPGTSVEQLYLQEPAGITALLPALAEFIRKLHQSGVYFRSLHLGNIIQLPGGQFGLIDILDLHVKSRPLSRGLVRRNFQHLHHYLTRRDLQGFPTQTLIDSYHQSPTTKR
ncbi:toluene tolerance protein [Pseudomonas sp. GD03909]|nr:toluene tolerance protein [Pseudomonas sp. GD03909]